MTAASVLSGPWRYALGGLVLAALGAGAYLMMRPDPAAKEPVMAEVPSKVDPRIRARIDRWIEDNHLNHYGDPAGSSYAGGTPLFDMHTGERRDRYEYILEKHPELGRAEGAVSGEREQQERPPKPKSGTGK